MGPKKAPNKKTEKHEQFHKQVSACKYGKKCQDYWCPFKHVDETGRELNKKEYIICPFFIKNKCKKGDQCIYMHPT